MKGRIMPRDKRSASEYMSVTEAAERLEVSRDTIRRRISDGTIPAYRIAGQAIRLRRAELDALVRLISVDGFAGEVA